MSVLTLTIIHKFNLNIDITHKFCDAIDQLASWNLTSGVCAFTEVPHVSFWPVARLNHNLWESACSDANYDNDKVICRVTRISIQITWLWFGTKLGFTKSPVYGIYVSCKGGERSYETMLRYLAHFRLYYDVGTLWGYILSLGPPRQNITISGGRYRKRSDGDSATRTQGHGEQRHGEERETLIR